MAVLEKIRVKFGLAVSIIIALALLSFIIDPSTIETAMQAMSSKYDVGLINGKSISYTDFLSDVDKFTKINELMSGSSVQNEEQQTQVRNAAWQSLIDKYLFVENAEKAGIKVGKAELVALTGGDMVSPVLAQNPAFQDEQGNFSKEALLNFLKNLSSDNRGVYTLFWDYIQNTIYNQQYYQKYGALFAASAFKTPLEINNAIAENNNTANVDFVMIPFGFEPDSTVNVSKSEISKYYNEHKAFFKQPASRDIEYVVYEVTPSEHDINEVSEKFNASYEGFASAENMKNYLAKNSERAYSDNWYKAGDLVSVSREVDDFVSSHKSGVSPIYKTADHFYAVRILASEKRSESVYVKHILLQGEKAKHLADSLLPLVKASNFASLAALYSSDQGSRDNGEIGNIGWLSGSRMVPGYEAVLDAKTGKPFIINSQYGTSIVLVSEKSEPVEMKKVAILDKSIIASQETINGFYAKANKFASLASGSYKNYKAATDTLGVYSHTMNNVLESTSSYGAIDNAKEVTRWIFDNKAGKVSNIISVNNAYFFVVTVKGIHKEGIASLEEVYAPIRERLYAEKLGVAKAAQIKAKIEGLTDLNAIAEKLGASVSNESSVAFASMGALNLDPNFIGAVASAKEGVVTGPIAGQIGTYIFKVNSRDNASFYTEEDAKNYSTQMNQYNRQMILPVMINDADVKDHRARFF